MAPIAFVPVALLVLAVPAPPRAAPASDATYASEWKAWHERREERLRAPDGWLALVGLHWLAEGPNVLPGLPGTFVLQGGKVTLRASPGDGWTQDGQPVAERAIATDASPEPDDLAVGTRRVMVIDRAGKLAVRVWDAASPARVAFRGVPTYPVDRRWRVEARWEPYPAPRKVVVPSVAGPPQEAEAPGRAHFTIDGREVALEPTAEEGGALFFVFRDRTAPAETYGGGRFLYAEAPRDGKVILDFNRAYSPPCAFTPYATCPLPRPENVLRVRIPAGEKKLH